MNWGGIAFVLLMICKPFAAAFHERRHTLNAKPETLNENPKILNDEANRATRNTA